MEFTRANIIGQSKELKYVLHKVEQVAPFDTTVIIRGETGTGKELIARAIHGFSQRKDRPMIKMNCATLPVNLIESELFGSERGAFTGAQDQRVGRFEHADGATLFLDEIGELSLEGQAKLLRVLEHGEFERLGSVRTVKVDVRIIAATNRNLEQDVQTGRFRRDLWYRLDVYPITVPALRMRKDDIPLLVDGFVKELNARLGKRIETISQDTMKVLQEYSWPGNVRELNNVIERSMLNSQGTVLQLDNTFPPPQNLEVSPGLPSNSLVEVERAHIFRILEVKSWRIEGEKGAAQELGLHPSTLRGRMRTLGITLPSRPAHPV